MEKRFQDQNSFGGNFHAAKMAFKLLLTILLLATFSRSEHFFESTIERLKNYDHEISVLSWPYDEETKDVLSESNLFEWSPVVSIYFVTKNHRQGNGLFQKKTLPVEELKSFLT